MLRWLGQLVTRQFTRPKAVPEVLWLQTLEQYPFLRQRPPLELAQLRTQTEQFLNEKEFFGARGLVVTDEMAVAIAAQACLPVLHLGLRWYNDFKGIVVHSGAMVARREVMDDAGVVHRYNEVLTGEAMQHGPVTLSWQDVALAGEAADAGYNVVIHEFAHKLDMRTGEADGCPPLPAHIAARHWQGVLQAGYDQLREQVVMAERFGGKRPWLDDYGATAPAEFFAVACEAYFVNRTRFSEDFSALTDLFDDFFGPRKKPV